MEIREKLLEIVMEDHRIRIKEMEKEIGFMRILALSKLKMLLGLDCGMRKRSRSVG